jgi:hypothetical protein
MGAEYRIDGHNFDGSANYERIYDFNRPIEAAAITDHS